MNQNECFRCHGPLEPEAGGKKMAILCKACCRASIDKFFETYGAGSSLSARNLGNLLNSSPKRGQA